jgi:polyphosphate glucokinase
MTITAFGLDIGGTGIKGGIVNLLDGHLVGDRFREDTPQPATPEAVAATVKKVIDTFDYNGRYGVAFPGVVSHGVVQTSANVDDSWQGISLVDTLRDRVPGPISAINDADAAGLAEARYGAGRGNSGLIVVITFGTGIGSALIHHEKLIPNSELGHLELDGHDAETQAAASARERLDLSWDDWARRANRYLSHLESILYPDLFIVGGGISTSPEKWIPRLKTKAPLKLAALRNNAGIVGAALAAAGPDGPLRGTRGNRFADT